MSERAPKAIFDSLGLGHDEGPLVSRSRSRPFPRSRPIRASRPTSRSQRPSGGSTTGSMLHRSPGAGRTSSGNRSPRPTAMRSTENIRRSASGRQGPPPGCHPNVEAHRIQGSRTEAERTSAYEFRVRWARRGKALQGLASFATTEPGGQRHIAMQFEQELPHEARRQGVDTWCRAPFKGLAWPAVIDRREDRNEARIRHAHIAYSIVAIERRESGVGWTFEDSPSGRPRTKRCGPSRATARSVNRCESASSSAGVAKLEYSKTCA